MKIYIKESTMVKPAEETLTGSLWISVVDQVMHNYHSPVVYIYRKPIGVANFFDSAVLKAALGRALVAFYPAAGRLKMNEDGCIGINCNSEGVLFVEAESDGTLDDLGEYFKPNPNLSLIPTVDYSKGISTYPLVLLQVTHFKCGGVSLGFKNEHHLSDGIAAFHFINTWADLARGLDITIPPVIDRSHLSARHPPQPKFNHVEFYQPAPALYIQSDVSLDQTTLSIFKITRVQLNALKSDCSDISKYSSFEVLAGHIWRCACNARGLKDDQTTRIRVPIDGRSRFKPQLPRGYYGNVIFPAYRTTFSGEICSKPLNYVVSIIHDSIAKMNNDYLRSTIDYLELRRPNFAAYATSDDSYKCPNVGINTWVRMPIYDADFGWGKPAYFGPAAVSCEGKIIMFPSGPTINDGSILLSVTLPKEHMSRFEKMLYQIPSHNKCSKL